MYFVIASIIIAAACSVISIKTIVGYNDYGWFIKSLISFLIVLGWVSPLLIAWIRNNDFISGDFYNIVSYAGYYLFGLVFLLFVMLILRDFIWYFIYGIAKIFNSANWWIDPKNLTVLKYANWIVIFLVFAISFYSVYEAVRVPLVKNVTFTTNKIKRDLSIVQLSDLHINRASSVATLQAIVDKTNELNPDIIVLTGDVVDDKMDHLDKYMDVLAGLKAQKGIYFSVGNHENYNGLYQIIKKLTDMGVKVLFNRGEAIPDHNIFISGIPDMQTAMSSDFYAVNFEKAIRGTKAQNYRILLSHNPEIVDYVVKGAFDLQLSGHTHGGQIFPFHILAKKANKYLAGAYKVNDVDVYVSRGTGYWGPSMRLFAPSEISHIVIKAVEPEKSTPKNNGRIDKNMQEMMDTQNLGLGL